MLQQGIYDKPELRLMVEAMLYRMRVGCLWRDLPAEFGNWNTIYQTFNRWSCKDKLVTIFKCLVDDPDLEWEFIDGSIVRAHQHSAGAIGKENQAIGKSVGGNTTKIHMAVNAFGLPIEFDLTGGEVHDRKAAPELIARFPLSDYIKAMTVKIFEYSFEKKDRHPLFRRKRIQKQGMVTWIGVCTNIGIWSKMFLHASNTSE